MQNNLNRLAFFGFALALIDALPRGLFGVKQPYRNISGSPDTSFWLSGLEFFSYIMAGLCLTAFVLICYRRVVSRKIAPVVAASAIIFQFIVYINAKDAYVGPDPIINQVHFGVDFWAALVGAFILLIASLLPQNKEDQEDVTSDILDSHI